MARPSSTPLLLCCLLVASFLIAGATLTPVSNCAKSGRQACILISAKQDSKLTCCKKNAACPYSYPKSGCVDLLTDRGYCGSCTNFCAKDKKCVSGKCVSVPPPPPEDFSCAAILCLAPSTCCNGTCVDLQTSFSNCGQCGRSCPTYPPGMMGIPFLCAEGDCFPG